MQGVNLNRHHSGPAASIGPIQTIITSWRRTCSRPPYEYVPAYGVPYARLQPCGLGGGRAFVIHLHQRRTPSAPVDHFKAGGRRALRSSLHAVAATEPKSATARIRRIVPIAGVDCVAKARCIGFSAALTRAPACLVLPPPHRTAPGRHSRPRVPSLCHGSLGRFTSPSTFSLIVRVVVPGELEQALASRLAAHCLAAHCSAAVQLSVELSALRCFVAQLRLGCVST